MKVTVSSTFLGLAAAASAASSAVVHSSHLKTAPALPLGLFKKLRALEAAAAAQRPATSSYDPNQLVFDAASAAPDVTERERLAAKYPAYTFDQRTSHDAEVVPVNGRETFKQRYWFDASYYKPGGPVIFLNGGETDAEVRLPFLETGIVKILMEATGGIGVIHEHRYYGQSWPVDDLRTDNWRYLTTLQSLEDANYFAQNIVFPGLEQLNLTSKDTPWISYGGSYAGAQSAFLRAVFPDVWHGAIASSAVTKAITDYWQYHEPIRVNAPAECMRLLESHTATLDTALGLHQPFITKAVKSFFGLGGVTSDLDFVNALSIPLGFWQARNWDPAVSTSAFDEYCDALTAEQDSAADIAAVIQKLLPEHIASALTSLGRPSSPLEMLARLSNYAKYVRENIASICPSEEEQDACFSTDEYYQNGNNTIEAAEWKAWPYQYCTEWGYFQGAPPADQPTIVSRLLTTAYTSKICQLAFSSGELVTVPATPDVDVINQYGAFEVEASRLAFVDGSADPWIYATPHSPDAPNAGVRPDSLDKPFKLIRGGVHHWDENGLPHGGNEPSEIVQIHASEVEFVKSWLKEWKKKD